MTHPVGQAAYDYARLVQVPPLMSEREHYRLKHHTPARHTPRWQRRQARQALAAPDARHGGWTDGSRLDAARDVALPRAAMAAASGGVSKSWWWEAARGWGLSRRRASIGPASRASPGVRGPLGGHNRPFV
jgi:hypothetical protein